MSIFPSVYGLFCKIFRGPHFLGLTIAAKCRTLAPTMKPDTAKRRPANPSDNRLTVRFSPEEIRRIVSDSRKRRVFPSDTVRRIIRLYYAPKTRRVK
jgi:hypothetical protein